MWTKLFGFVAVVDIMMQHYNQYNKKKKQETNDSRKSIYKIGILDVVINLLCAWFFLAQCQGDTELNVCAWMCE